MLKTLLVSILALVPLFGMCQNDWRFRHITKNEGLSNNTVFSITQDDRGYIWLGTRNGLDRYDGYRMETLDNYGDSSNELVSNDIRALLYDSITESLWVGTQVGIGQVNIYQNKITNHFIKEAISVHEILRSNRHGLLFGTDHGLISYDDETGAFSFISNGLTGSANLVYQDNSENIWVASNDGLFVSSKQNEMVFRNATDLYPELLPIDGIRIETILEDDKGRVWLGTDGEGLIIWNKQNRTLTYHRHDAEDMTSLSSDRIRNVIQNLRGDVLVGTAVGLNIYRERDGNFDRVVNDGSNLHGLSNNSIRSMYVDKKGGLWIGTYYRGVNYTDESFGRFGVSYPYSNTLVDDRNIIGAITSDADGTIWIGTEGQGLGIWNPQNLTFELLDLGSEFENPNIKVILPKENHTWIGTFQEGLYKMDERRQIVERYHESAEGRFKLSNNNIYDLIEVDDRLIMASYGGGLIVLEEGESGATSFLHNPRDPKSIISNDVRVLHKDGGGEIWLGTGNGISRIVKSEAEGVVFENLLEGKNVYSIQSNNPDVLWVGTFHSGLYRYDKSSEVFTNYSIDQGLPGNTVYTILPTANGLWLSTNNGIVEFDIAKEEFISYGNDIELEGLDYIPNSSHTFRDDLYLFGSNSGLVFFRPEEITLDDYQSPLLISDIQVFGDPAINLSQDDGSIQLEYNHSNLRILFTSLDYTNPKNNRYAFRMNGVDADWIYNMGSPEAVYTLQREGDYLFEFRGSNSDGVWNPNTAQLRIHISPPWFRSWPAYLAYVIVFLGIMYVLYRWIRLRNSYKIEHVAKVEQERSHQLKTRFFTNITHELRTPLTLMLGPLQDIIGKDDIRGPIRNKLEGVHKNVIRLSHLVNQLLDFRKLETDHMKMRVVEGDIVDFLKEIYYAFREETTKRNIDFIFESENESLKCWYDSDKMEKVFFNLLSNALKFTTDFGLIKIVVEEVKGQIRITVSDNGEGIDEVRMEHIFERFYERNSLNYSNYGVGIGLALSKQLIELHHGNIYAKNNEGSGTSFVVELLKGSRHFEGEEVIREVQQIDKVETKKTAQPEEIEPNAERNLKVLIVEDDLEIQEYISSLFANEYQVVLASNGQVGFEVAKNKLPDAIISDVMMPVEDGISMCRRLKTTIETSHIPIILLTARAATPYKIGGLETGADDYLTKPFNSEELILKVKNMLSARAAYLDKLSRTHDFDPKRIAVTSTDETFLNRLMEITEQNIENRSLTVEQIADHLNVSRALLFTKIKTLTGNTPKGFIKEYRLKRARQLLEDTDLNISQVAHKSGFHDYRYFTKVFKAKYGVSPKEHSKSNAE